MVLPWIIAAAKKIGECCAGPIVEFIKTEVGHLINYSAYLEKLREQAENLSDAAESVNGRIKEAENHRGETAVDATVMRWKTRTTSLQEDADKIIAEEEKAADGRCLMGLRTNLWACYQVSKSAKKAIDKAVQLLEEEKKLARVANTDYSECLGVIPNPDFEEFKSRDQVSHDIVAALKDPSVNMVGVFGMGGVGKTTLVEKVADQLQKDRTFDFVVKATVSHVPDLRKIQGEIADPLKIKLEAETVQGRALQLMERLDKRGKLLIVLDDIWEGIPLKEIGIPFGTRRAGRRDEKGGHFDSLAEGADDDTKTSSRSSTHDCKILMTSRSETVLDSKMGSPRNFPLQELDDVDAWKLFQKTLGSTPEDPSWRSIANQVVERCSGIPVLLDVVSRALKDKDLQTWMGALEKLKTFDKSELIDTYYLKIELSYSHLRGEEIKSLFRLLGQMDPHYISVSDLLRYTMGLGIFKRCTSVEHVRNELHICLNNLKDYGLLHDVNKEGRTVRMHDVVHKFAAYVGSKHHHIFTVSVADKLEEWPEEDDLKQFKAISFWMCRLPHDELPASFDSPELESFLMLKNERDPTFKIPDKFFEGMKGLKLLHLTEISLLPALPTSLEVLVKLKTLCLDYCELDDIAIIGELPRLQVLSLIGSTIIRLPKELGKLTRLKILDLDNCSSLKEIDSDVLSKMTSLEELNMRKSFKYWEKEGYCSSNSTIETILKNASLGELKNRPNLIYLSIHIPHAEMLPNELLLFENLKSFKILVGEAWHWDNDYGTSKTLKLKLVECAQLEYGGIKALIGRAEDVYLQQLNGFESLCKFDSQGFPLMKHLNVQNGVQIRYIVISISSCVVFPKLETLVLQDLEKLEKIIYHGGDGQLLKSGSFENLSKIKVERCNGLKDLFSSSLARGFLLRLKEIEVIDCQNMQTIVSTTGEIMGEMLFPHLNFIKLKSLPKLKTFCTADYIGCPFLQKLLIEDCPELKTFATNYASTDTTLFDGKVEFPHLEELTLQKNMDGLKTIWGDELHPNSFSKLKTLKIEDGSALLNVFPPSMLRTRLLNIQNLVISRCSSLEKVFDVQMLINERELHVVLTPTQLTSITIRELPKLKHVWNRDPRGLLSYQNLCSVNASLCPTLNSLFPVSVALTLQQLKELKIAGCEGMEEIVSKEEEDQEQSCAPRFVFPKVTHLLLWNLQALKRFYPGYYSSDWPKLSKLSVFGCDKFDIFGPKLEIIQDEACKEEQRDIQVHRQPFLSFTKVISSWEEVSLRSQDLDVICDQGLFTHNKLKILNLHFFLDSSHVFPVSFLQRFPNLEKLVVSYSFFKLLFPDELVADETNAKTLARISQLRLCHLPIMTHIWDSNSQLDVLVHDLGRLEVSSCHHLINLAPSTALFENLTYLDVSQCDRLITLLASSTAKSLVQLKKMWITKCSSLVEIVANDEDEACMEDIVYEKLEVLTLQALASLTSFCSATCNFKFPSLVSVKIVKCPKMQFFSQGVLNTPKLTKVWVKEEIVEKGEGRWLGELNSTVRQLYKEMDGFRCLQQLKLSEFPELKNIWLGKLPVALFSDLKLLEISECTFSSYAISSSMLLSLNNLEELQVTKCNSLEEIFDGSEELRNRNASENVGSFSELKKFYLADLSRLRHVWPKNLEEILDFKNLSLLNICNCSSLRYVFTPSMILCLVQLQEIVVKNCACVEEIILKGEKEDGMGNNSVLIFPQLNILLLESLPCLASFCSGNGVLECPCLGTITIVDCPKLETFTSTLLMQQELAITEGNGETLHTLTKPLFNDKVAFPNLEELTLQKNMDGLKTIWGNELHPNSFSKLKTLKIEDGSALLNVFPPSMLRTGLLNLQNLVISCCSLLEKVFDVQMLINERELHVVLTPTQLTSITIRELPKLKHVWNRDPRGLLSYQNLCSVNASLCPTLNSLFPVSVALTLQQLKELKIAGCEGMEEIVSKEEEDQEQSCAPRFVFPKVTHLLLWNLQALKRFYPGSYSSDWPKLSKLSVYGCQKFDIFGPKLEIIQDEACKKEQRDIQVQRQPFLSFTKFTSNLEEVSLRSQDLDVICGQGLFTDDKLKILELQCFHDSSHVFPVSFLQRFPNLEKLVVACSDFKQLFPDELVADQTNAKTLARISQLRLHVLPKMTHIWDSNSQLDVLLHDLRLLEVWTCHHLINLAPSKALFENLTYLVVCQCKGLITLLTSFTTKSLVQLKNMWITKCSSLVEIVANDEDEACMEDIVYEKLEVLTLESLASLTSFCSATCNFKFPSLVFVKIVKCPKMQFFSQGVLNTPKLTKVWVKEEIVEEGDGRWLGELNSTVRQLYKEMDGFRCLQQLKLSEFPELKNIWLGKLPVALFSDLKLLEISECTFSSYAISSSMLLSLNNLEELQVTKCNSLEEIFDGSEELRNRNASENVGSFSELKKFYLADLSRLRHVWPKNLEEILDFKNLSLLNICNCSSLRYVFTPSMILCLVQLQEIVVKNCACVEEIILKGEKEDGMGNNSVLIFPQLHILLLQSLPCLASFCSGSGVLECPCLGTITIVDCPKLETFTSTLLTQQELTTTEENGETLHTLTKPLFNDKVAFPSLEELKFVKMDGMKMIWQNELHPSSFLKLKTLKIEKASTLLTIFPPAMVKRALNLENLTISNCESVQEVFDVQMLINESDIHGEVLPTQLRSLDISNLPKLKHVWNRDPHGLLSYQNLCFVNSSLCPTLKSLFSVSVALTLQQLEELKIDRCEGMEEIVSKEEEDQEQSYAPRFVFPKVRHLLLWNLQALKRFYPGSYSSDWPKLSKLSVFGCDKFDIFGPKLEIIHDEACREEQRDIQVQRQPFLSFTKVISNLEEVSLRSQDLDVICGQGLFTANKLNFLELKCFHDSSHVFPVSFLQRFPNLEKLVVACSDFKQLFPDELVADETNAKTLARISQLRLDLLPEMTHIWDSNSQLDVLLHGLGRLEVYGCYHLINLAPSTALFENLTYLDVWLCDGLITLLASSTMKSLAQLKKMRIRECSSLVEIVANDEDEARMEDIVYEKLEGLTLQSLASLTSFCSATCNFKFPSLVSVIMAECPKMEFFSQGVLNTPKLRTVWVKKEDEEEDEGRWMGNLNSTTSQLYKEMNTS